MTFTIRNEEQVDRNEEQVEIKKKFDMMNLKLRFTRSSVKCVNHHGSCVIHLSGKRNNFTTQQISFI